MSVSDDNLAAIKKAYKLFFDGEIDRFFEIFDDDVELIEAEGLPYGGVYRGKETVREAILSVMSYWDKMTLDLDVIAAEGDYVIGYGTFAATGLKTGRKVSFRLAEVWKLRNGRVVMLSPVYGDTKLASEALGHVSEVLAD
ncbi:nuclear transport factor 2 family protein [Rhizorhabdus argentea]|uniref:nuclear transport factor 2 family protein n=1 Tax=Rhizorhabdus argentea TaxID=1387174 RepID=UPI0030EC0923